MKSKIFLPVLMTSTLLAGCAGVQNNEQVNPVGTGPLADCNLPAARDSGPIRPPMYVSGTFSDGQWMHQEHRRMTHKGNGIYQVVMDNEQGPVNFQFASMSWNPQYTARGGRMTVGQEVELNQGGFMKDTRVTIPAEGRYVWSFQVSENREPVRAMISKCAE